LQNLLEALRKLHKYNAQQAVPFTFDFIRVKSYQGTASTGNVTVSGADIGKLSGKHILVIEDIIDSGKRDLVLASSLLVTGCYTG
jgi:hypoxanthine-guanine phosphoribosyltransferase